jgi:hypothetical protein
VLLRLGAGQNASVVIFDEYITRDLIQTCMHPDCRLLQIVVVCCICAAMSVASDIAPGALGDFQIPNGR